MKHCKICFNEIDKGGSIFDYLFNVDCICMNCRERFERNQRVYHFHNLEIHAFYIYNEFLENLLFQYKESRDIALYDVFLTPHIQEMNDIFRQTQCVIMPSSHKKTSQRGFHALKEMLSVCDVQVCDPFRKENDIKQSTQSKQMRLNIESYLQVDKTKIDLLKAYCLFDDVCTTGSTLKACAHMLDPKASKITAYVLCVHPAFVEMCDEKWL